MCGVVYSMDDFILNELEISAAGHVEVIITHLDPGIRIGGQR